MKNQSLILLTLAFLTTGSLKSQRYFSTAGEMIFSGARGGEESGNGSSIARFSFFWNGTDLLNYDLNRYLGLYTGISIRNIGFIRDFTDTVSEIDSRIKHRTYNIGIPLGIKVGNLKKTFIYFGAEPEYPFHYKEKIFIGDSKEDKISEWFSRRVEPFQIGLFCGINLPWDLDLTFKYYITPFLNYGYTYYRDAKEFRPYEGLDVNMVYFSLTSGLFKESKRFFNRKDKENMALTE